MYRPCAICGLVSALLDGAFHAQLGEGEEVFIQFPVEFSIQNQRANKKYEKYIFEDLLQTF